MSTKIYYFSGTGNSLFIAKELRDRIPDAELIPIVKAIEEGNYATNAETIGFVFPTHGLTIPFPVREFLKKMDSSSATYFFAAATRGGTVFRGFAPIRDALQNSGKHLNASFLINMTSNDPKLEFYRDPTAKEMETSHAVAYAAAEKIADIVSRKEDFHADDTTGVTFTKNHKLLNAFLERLIPFMTHYISPKIKKYFYADGKCTGCGTCATVCLSRKIIMKDGKPFWQPDTTCYLCYSCLNYCPAKAVQIHSKWWMKSFTTEKGRYCHPYATITDLAGQKKN